MSKLLCDVDVDVFFFSQFHFNNSFSVEYLLPIPLHFVKLNELGVNITYILRRHEWLFCFFLGFCEWLQSLQYLYNKLFPFSLAPTKSNKYFFFVSF